MQVAKIKHTKITYAGKKIGRISQSTLATIIMSTKREEKALQLTNPLDYANTASSQIIKGDNVLFDTTLVGTYFPMFRLDALAIFKV